ncbi:hypothetical protein GJS30_08195 [Bacillus velezensis]|nr:hypothetical protein [Bacillus amyloliquefaciens]NRR85365.1 hypothetical protein [Bacillus velezensis]NRS10293.1 hypothetical protein [Bacillus velezensis]QLG09227.1 hypothetical protein GJS30_08195 [Bacillus velezensis]TWO90872.1 hypothetical protein EUA42_12675 [Bacillus velezensis]
MDAEEANTYGIVGGVL